MRGSRRLLSIVVATGALLSVAITSIPNGHAAPSATDALRAKRSQLVAQLAAVASTRDSAASVLSQAEQAFNNAQNQYLTAQSQLATLNVELLTLSGQIASDEATIADAKQQLGLITRQTYESTTTNSWVAAVLSAQSFTQAMDRLTGTSHLAEQVTFLQDRLRNKERAISDERTRIIAAQASSLALEAQLGRASTSLLVLVEQRNTALMSASGPVRAIALQIAGIDQQIANTMAPRPLLHTASSASCGNHFAYGQCTFYVASRRCIPWVGNARDWFYRAEAYGYPVGHTPQVGAVVVFWPGGDGASSVGHVAYVEAVGPSSGIPAGMFKLSEMNFNGGWNRVSYRLLPSNSRGIQGFIYAK